MIKICLLLSNHDGLVNNQKSCQLKKLYFSVFLISRYYEVTNADIRSISLLLSNSYLDFISITFQILS